MLCGFNFLKFGRGFFCWLVLSSLYVSWFYVNGKNWGKGIVLGLTFCLHTLLDTDFELLSKLFFGSSREFCF